MNFETLVVHAGQSPEKLTGALATPIYQTSTFAFESTEDAINLMSGKKQGYVYSRVANPTQSALEEKMAILENGESALAVSSGMAAISTAILSIASNKDHVIADGVLYGSTYDLLNKVLPRFGIEVTFVDTSNITEIENAIKSNTKLIFFETPANPTMKLTDIKAVSDLAQEKNIKVIVDNTYLTPYFQKPLNFGADVVVHSATKYISGHGDVIAGIIVSSEEFIRNAKKSILKNLGCSISPFNAYLLLRGIKTLVVRMDKHNKNAMEIASFLEKHPRVKKVYYPSLPSYPQNELAKKQMSGSGGMIAFELYKEKDAMELLNKVELCTLAVSLGDTDTLIQHPATMTHAVIPRKERIKFGITEEMVRISVGIEDAKDIIFDLERGLA
ncbi:MAG TPA: PLP-dependent transferase [Methanosarcinales archaeon]|nr:PLP-dependent transferase [Methanosarcinales archaeon]